MKNVKIVLPAAQSGLLLHFSFIIIPSKRTGAPVPAIFP
jgi:hypothetical protein